MRERLLSLADAAMPLREIGQGLIKERVLDLISDGARVSPHLDARMTERMDATDRMLSHMIRDAQVPTEVKGVVEQLAVRFLAMVVSDPALYSDSSQPLVAMLDRLEHMPVDHLKVDGFFVRDLVAYPNDLAIVKSINEVVHFMGKETIAEYVQSREIRERLLEIGADYVQGYAVAKPQFLDEVTDAVDSGPSDGIHGERAQGAAAASTNRPLTQPARSDRAPLPRYPLRCG